MRCLPFHSKSKFNDVFMILQDGVCCDFAVLNGRYVAACFEVSLYSSVTRNNY